MRAFHLTWMAFFCWRCTQDMPEGNFSDLRAGGVATETGKKGGAEAFKQALSNYRSGCWRSPAVPALGGVAGNVGAVAAGFLLKATGTLPDALYALGWIVLGSAACAAAVRFSITHKQAEQQLYDQAIAHRGSMGAGMAATSLTSLARGRCVPARLA